MISVWWTLVVFIGGGCAGVFLMALMRVAGDLPEQSATASREWAGNNPIRLPRCKETFCSFKCRDSYVDVHHLFQPDSEARQVDCQYFERGSQQMG